METAKLVKKVEDWRGDARLYKLSRPVKYGYPVKRQTSYVVVSAVTTYSDPETYIFPSNKKGEVLDGTELPGSFRGGLDHRKALQGAGYEEASNEPTV